MMTLPDPLARPPIGRSLRAQRDILGLSLDDAAELTMMRAETLRHIEADDFDTLPEPVFVRGYLRKYAHALGLSGEELVAQFDLWQRILADMQAEAAAQTMPAPTPLSARLSSQLVDAGHGLILITLKGWHEGRAALSRMPAVQLPQVVGICCAAGLACLFMLPTDQPGGQGPTPMAAVASARAETAAPLSQPAVAVTPAASTPLAVPAVAEHQPAIAATVATMTPPAASKHVAAAKVAGAAAVDMTTTLVASDLTHVRVSDSHGLVVFNGLLHRDETLRLSGEPPFHIVPARPGLVKVWRNGRNITDTRLAELN